ncbi:MAG TPA: (d)CMP kinase [Pirellulales bacterium]
MVNAMIVTIDGPAGSGKSTAARRLAQRLGFRFLDTGAMYRAVALAALRAKLDWADSPGLAALARQLAIDVDECLVLLNGEDVSLAVRTPEVTAVTRYAADHPEVRAHLVEQQRRLGDQGNVVTEGRDQGTVVFPQAECKFFLTAANEVRARRRASEMAARGQAADVEDVLQKQNARDEQDRSRPVGPLAQASDALEIDTSEMTEDEVVAHLEGLVRRKMDEIGRR